LRPSKSISDNAWSHLVFNDTRKFGRVWLTPHPEEVLAQLGPEPFNRNFTPKWLHTALHSKHRQLKPLLLDQTFLAGLGNIYSDEALNLAKLNPLAASDSVTPKQAEALHTAIRRVLKEGIRRNGASIDWVYRGGEFQNYFRVYDRAGKPCPTCGTKIQRIVVGQRSTHFCPKCQVR
jgi:formamidopyrimidine-DNA glycosylase